MEKLSITLPDEMARIIRDRVDAGEYASTSEALRDAVRCWMRQEEERRERMAGIRARIQQSLSDPGASLSGEELDERLTGLYEAATASDAK